MDATPILIDSDAELLRARTAEMETAGQHRTSVVLVVAAHQAALCFIGTTFSSVVGGGRSEPEVLACADLSAAFVGRDRGRLGCRGLFLADGAVALEGIHPRGRPAKRTQDRPFQMRVSESFLRMVDDWRRGQIDVPSRAEAIRRMVELAVSAEKKSDGDR
jgi:hypothetical protein